MFVSCREHFVENEGVVAVKGEDHLAAFFIALALRVDVLDYLSCKSMQNQFVHLRADQLSEEFLLSL